jgi:hypothetical protein
MRTMFRHTVPVDDHPHAILLTSDPVTVAATGDAAVEFWAEHDESALAVTRMFQVFGTGQPLPGDTRWIGTCPRTDLGLVWHLYEVTP